MNLMIILQIPKKSAGAPEASIGFLVRPGIMNFIRIRTACKSQKQTEALEAPKGFLIQFGITSLIRISTVCKSTRARRSQILRRLHWRLPQRPPQIHNLQLVSRFLFNPIALNLFLHHFLNRMLKEIQHSEPGSF